MRKCVTLQMNMGNFIMYMYIYVLPCLYPNNDVIILRSVAACNGILERKIIVCYKHTCKISDTLF